MKKEIEIREELELSQVLYNGSGGFKFYDDSNSCYIENALVRIPCTSIIQSIHGTKFIHLKFVPDGSELKIPEIYFDLIFYLNLAREIDSEKEGEEFLLNFHRSFEANDWYRAESETNRLRVFRFVQNMNIELESKLNISLNWNALSTIQLLRCILDKRLPITTRNFLQAVPFEISKSSTQVLTLEAIRERLGEQLLNIADIQEFFSFPNHLIDEIIDIEFSHFMNLRKWDNPLWSEGYYREYYDQLEINQRVVDLNSEIYPFLATKFREVENELRVELGYTLVGGLINETILYNRVKETFTDFTVLSQYSPQWLRPQRFDIYIKEMDIAIEYNGLQHYEPVEYFGGQDGFKKTVDRDKKKRAKCKKNKCELLEIKYDQDIDEVIPLIKAIMNKGRD